MIEYENELFVYSSLPVTVCYLSVVPAKNNISSITRLHDARSVAV